MTRRAYDNLLLYSLFGFSLWFFGNLYEGVVMARILFSFSDPIVFYIPLAPLAIIALSSYIILKINLPLFFGDIGKIRDSAHKSAVLWNILNSARVLLLAAAVYQLFKAYLARKMR
jgi:hypothetical protein